jgi:putative membrane protein
MSTAGSPVAPSSQDRAFYLVNAVVSSAALALLAWLLLLRQSGESSQAVAFLPAVNAGLNFTAAAFLVLGRAAITRRKVDVHRRFMIAAFVTSTLFLVSYLTYHYLHGDTHFAGTGAARVVYLAILASHVLLSATVVPLALSAFWFAFRRSMVTHKKITRVLWPIWLYVSITGVVIYVMLRASASY